MKNPEHMNRKEKLAFLSALKRDNQLTEAYKWWLTHCPRISRGTFEAL